MHSRLSLFLVFGIMAGLGIPQGLGSPDKTSIENPQLVNARGDEIGTKINANQQVQIMCTVKNNQDQRQPFIYIVQIRDSSQKVVMLNWIGGNMLIPGQELSPALSWTPVNGGQYTVEIFVWDGFEDQRPLAMPSHLDITVS